jgi:hypothetical protein
LDNLSHMIQIFSTKKGSFSDYFSTSVVKAPQNERETVTFRKFRDVSKTDFIQDVENSPGFQNPKGPVEDLVTTCVSDFSTIIDNHAP